jgi:membrane fusion protein
LTAAAQVTDHADAEPARRPLFRPQVAQRNWEILESRGLMPHPPRLTALVLAILLLVFAAGGVMAVHGALPHVEFARGFLEPTGGVTRVRATRQAIISAIHVRDGQHVNQGDSLATLQSAQTTESGASAEAGIAAQLQSQRQDLDHQITREALWQKNEAQRLAVEADDLANDIELLAQSIQIQRDQVALVQRNAERVREAAERGTVAMDELQRRDMNVLNQRYTLQSAERELAAKRSKLAIARIAIEQLPTIASERLRGLRESLANVEQRLIELDTRRAVVVRAPVSGRIAAVPATVGAAIDSNNLIATIVPDGSELHARLLVPTRAIGKVHPGQKVSIRYEAFPYQKYGTFTGTVEDVSNSVLLPPDMDKIAPVKLDEPAYVLQVAIARQVVSLGGDRQAALRPDMLLTATVEVDRRPLLAWIGESVIGVSQH